MPHQFSIGKIFFIDENLAWLTGFRNDINTFPTEKNVHIIQKPNMSLAKMFELINLINFMVFIYKAVT